MRVYIVYNTNVSIERLQWNHNATTGKSILILFIFFF